MLTLKDLNRKNFKAKEFYFSDTANQKGIDNNPKEQATLSNLVMMASKMQEMRSSLGKSMTITSGYRCEELNNIIGGAKGSFHLLGLAMDFICGTDDPTEIAKILRDSGIDFDKVIASYQYSRNTQSFRKWVHVQIRPNSADNRNQFIIEIIDKNGIRTFKKLDD